MKRLRERGIFILVVLLLALSVFSLSRYAPLLKAKQELEKQNQEAKTELLKLRSDLNDLLAKLKEQETISQQVQEENSGLKVNIAKIQQDLNITNEQLELLTSNLLVLSRENTALKEDKQVLAERLDKAIKENEDMLAKMSSISGLQKMIAQIKKQISENKLLLFKKLDEKKLAEGNKGFIIKDGEITSPPKVNIEVTPAS